MTPKKYGNGYWNLIHRYLGLFFGIWMCTAGVTGAVMTYYREIDVFLNPDFFRVSDSPRHPDLDAMVDAVQDAFPDRFILTIDRYFLNNDESYPFILSEPMPRNDYGLILNDIGNYEAAASLEVFVDPRTATIVGTRSYWTWIKIVRSFHRDLLMPGKGRKFLGAFAIVVFFTCIAGGVLWWKTSKRKIKRGLSIRLSASKPRILRDMHTTLGAYAVIVIGWLSFSAALICYETPLRNLSNFIIGKENRRPEVALSGSDSFISLNAARDVVLAEYPNSDIVLIRMAQTPDGRHVFRLYPADEPTTIYTRQVSVNAGSAVIVGRFDPANQPWTDSLFGVWLIWFHNGGMLGTPGKMLNLVAGVTLASLFPTGVYIWWRKRTSRVQKSR